MKNIISRSAIIITAAGIGVVGPQVYNEITPPTSTKKMIAYNPNSFGKKLPDTTIRTITKMIGLKPYDQGYETTEIIEGKDIPPGFIVVEDREYHLDFLTGCSKKPDTPTPVEPGIQRTPWGIRKIHALEAQKITDAKEIIVCVPDTGGDSNHPDIKNMIIGGSGHVSGNRSWEDNQGHGTHVLGTIAGQANDIDVIGVSQAKIFVVKVLNSAGRGNGSWIASGIVSCVNNGAHIISMSLGSPASSGIDTLIADAVAFAQSRGVIVVAATGNDGGAVGYPAALPDVIGVAASDINDRIASFSNRGVGTDIIAPGVAVTSTRMGGGTTTMSGTSMATPHVAGALALALSVGGTLQAVDIGLTPHEQGMGRLDALKGVE